MNSTSSAFRQPANTWGSSVKASSANSKGSSGLFGSTKSSSSAFGGKSKAKCDNCSDTGNCLKSFTKQPCEKKYDW